MLFKDNAHSPSELHSKSLSEQYFIIHSVMHLKVLVGSSTNNDANCCKLDEISQNNTNRCLLIAHVIKSLVLEQTVPLSWYVRSLAGLHYQHLLFPLTPLIALSCLRVSSLNTHSLRAKSKHNPTD